MRVLVISDIHANLTALEAVLADAGQVDATWCLGDLVGYGPDPNECVFQVQHLPKLVCLIGNHDAAALSRIDLATFNLEARQALRWTQNGLTTATKEYLGNLPERVVIDQVTLVHGSPRQPVWEYLLDTRAAKANFAYLDTPYCFVGHSHLPVIFQLMQENNSVSLSIPVPQSCIYMMPRAIYNPGSVGQPRDHDPRASYAIFDPQAQTWEYHRVAYDITNVQERMRQFGLPQRHIQRLSEGW